MGTLPFALLGSIWLLYWQGFNFSIAVAVGFIALAGVAVEISVIMLVYLNQAWRNATARKQGLIQAELKAAIIRGAGLRVRPVMMTAAAITAGLLPILLGAGTGSEVMSRIAAPMVGGMISAVPLTLLVLPAVYYLWKKRQCVAPLCDSPCIVYSIIMRRAALCASGSPETSRISLRPHRHVLWQFLEGARDAEVLNELGEELRLDFLICAATIATWDPCSCAEHQ